MKAKKKTPVRRKGSTALVKKETGLPKKIAQKAFVREELTEDYILRAFDMLGIASKLDERQKRLFITVARENHLNPLKRQIHAVAMWDPDTGENKLVPVTGYEVYVDRAEESGRLQYWNPIESGLISDAVKGTGDFRCTVVIKRRDWPREFEWTVHYSEVVRKKKDGTTGRMWRERPKFMTMKVAISQGFRLCFRDVLQGMPYTFDEMTDGEAENGRAHYREDFKKDVVHTVFDLNPSTGEGAPMQEQDTGNGSKEGRAEPSPADCKALYDAILPKLEKLPTNTANKFRDNADRNLDQKNSDALKALLDTVTRMVTKETA